MALVHIIAGESERACEIPCGSTLFSALMEAGAAIDAPCGGRGHCGKCLVRARGALSPVSEAERKYLPGDGYRLACCAVVEGECTVICPQSQTYAVQTAGWTAAAQRGESRIPDGCGIAVDIGTTTIAAYLLEDGSPDPVQSLGARNLQCRFGADVLSRIAYTQEHGGEALRTAVIEQLDGMFSALCEGKRCVTRAVITGNTTMLHLLCGLDATGIALAPFVPQSLFGVWDTLELPSFGAVEVYYPPCVSAYIGADITCGALAVGLDARPGNVLFLDVGTNGEMILKTKDRMLACSTAAGPAFEGAGISCGSGAVPGAISRVFLQSGKVCCETVGGAPAASLCGSGLIDAVAVFRRCGILNRRGGMDRACGGACAIANTGITLTQRDVRELQLAKGAIRAGIDTLLEYAGLDAAALDEVILAGGFGSCMNPDSAAEIGLFPDVFRRKTVAVGNAAGSGAAALLLDAGAEERIGRLANGITCLSLSGNAQFAARFLKSMNLE